MLNHILFAIWFFSPAGVGTLFPVFAAHTPGLKRWDTPMDFGKEWHGARILGDHKTWRGFLAGGLAGALWYWMQTMIYPHSSFIQGICPADYGAHQQLIIGFLLGFGSVIGDAGGSFAKRRLSIPSGKSWFPYDQLDFIVGALLLSLLAIRLPWYEYLIIIVVWIGIHLLFGTLGYFTHLKDSPI